MNNQINNERIKQIGLIIIILLLGILIIWKLYFLMPAFLFALTGYFIMRSTFAKLVYNRKFKEWQAALLLIFFSILIIAIPVFLLSQLLAPKIHYLLANQELIKHHITNGIQQIHTLAPQLDLASIAEQSAKKILGYVPNFFNGALGIFTTLSVGYFFLYFMLVNMRTMETGFLKLLPMDSNHQNVLRKETRRMVVSNAIGIPIIALSQGVLAYIGYLIFGVPEALLWALVTCFLSFIPIVGTALVWLPMSLYLISTGNSTLGIGLIIYCAIILTNIDNVLRFTVLKKIGDVHPLISILGVIIGLNLFGFLGLIFGPLLIEYFLILLKVYKIEYVED
jgi:predicted PurR-regulated permease PerM